QQALQTHAEVVKAQEKVEQKQDIEFDEIPEIEPAKSEENEQHIETPTIQPSTQTVQTEPQTLTVGGISEPLPEGAFKSSERPTGVHTRIEEVAVQPVATESAPQQTVEAVRTSKEEQQTTAHAAETTGRPVARKIEPTGRVSVTYTPEGTRVET